MTVLSVPALVMAGIAFYVGLYHLLIYFRRRSHREHATFALLCFTMVLYVMVSVGLYNAASVEAGMPWQRLQVATLALCAAVFPWFFRDYFSYRRTIWFYVSSVCFVSLAVLGLLDQGELAWLVSRPAVKVIQLPFVPEIVYYEVTPGPLVNFQYAMAFLLFFSLSWSVVKLYRSGIRKRVTLFFGAMVITFAGGFNDVAVSNGLYQCVYVFEYTYLALILFMTYSLSREVVELAALKDSLRDRDVRYKTLFEFSPEPILLLSLDGIVLDCNNETARIIGLPREEILGCPLADFHILGREDLPRYKTLLSDVMQGEAVKPFELKINRADIGVSWLDMFPAVLERDGAVCAIQLVARDVTERKQMIEALSKSEERLALALHGADLGMWDWNVQTGELILNQPWMESERTALGEAVPRFRFWKKLIHPKDFPRVMAALRAHLEDPSSFYEAEYRLRTKHGAWTWVLGRGEIMAWDATGQPLRMLGTHLDIDKRVTAECALRESEQMLQLIMDNIPQAVFWKSKQFVYLGCNRKFAIDAGLASPEAVVGKIDSDLPWAAFAERYRADDLQVMQTGEPKLGYEEPQMTPNGQKIWLRTSKVPLHDSSGEVIAILGMYQDITEQKRILEVLKQSEERYRLLFQRSPVGIFHYDHTLHITALNTRFAEIMRAKRMELMGIDLQTLDDQSLTPTLKLSLESVSGRYEGVYHAFHGASVIFISVRTAPYYSDNREIRGGIAIIEDITERKFAEDALRERAARLELISHIGQRTIAILDLDELLDQAVHLINDTFHYYNVLILLAEDEEIVIRAATLPAFQPLIGQVRLQIGLQGITGWVAKTGEALMVQDVSKEPRYYAEPEERETKSELAVPIKLKDAVIGVLTVESAELDAFSELDVFTLQTIADQLAIAIGNARLYAAAQEEIKRRRVVESEIRELNAELEHRVRERTAQLEVANKELSAFAYSVSHDLRAPLRGIDGFSQALLEDCSDSLDAAGQDYLRRVRAASQRMGQLIDDLLMLSRLTRSEMHFERVDLSALVLEIVDVLRAAHPGRQVEVVVAEGIMAKGDARLLRVMLENLLGNAWKFTGKQPSGRIEFGMTQIAETPGVYFVRDNGAGFDMAYADKLFAPFQRLHRVTEFDGTGIGLATVQRVVHRHGGRVWAEGAVGEGATFYFTL